MDNILNKRRDFIKKSLQISFVFVSISFLGCENKISSNPRKIKFGYDVCKRCKMLITDKNYVAQVINTSNNKHYNFDDIGCIVLWFVEEQIKWQNDALIYVADAKTKEWVDAKEAFWTKGDITPMNFGFSAHKLKPEGVKTYSFDEVSSLILGKRNSGIYL